MDNKPITTRISELFKTLTGQTKQPEKSNDGPSVGRTDGKDRAALSQNTQARGGMKRLLAPQIL